MCSISAPLCVFLKTTATQICYTHTCIQQLRYHYSAMQSILRLAWVNPHDLSYQQTWVSCPVCSEEHNTQRAQFVTAFLQNAIFLLVCYTHTCTCTCIYTYCMCMEYYRSVHCIDSLGRFLWVLGQDWTHLTSHNKLHVTVHSTCTVHVRVLSITAKHFGQVGLTPLLVVDG